MVFGQHLIIDANYCNGNIENIENINDFINDLCDIGKMEKKGELIIEVFEDNEFNRDNDLVGYSIVQIISLSNITLHINFISKTIYLDFFTCGQMNATEIETSFDKHFNPQTKKIIILNRDAINFKLPFFKYDY